MYAHCVFEKMCLRRLFQMSVLCLFDFRAGKLFQKSSVPFRFPVISFYFPGISFDVPFISFPGRTPTQNPRKRHPENVLISL